MRSSCERAASSNGSTPAGTSSGWRVTATSRMPAVTSELPELAEEVEHVRLVAGALPPEDVRVERDDLHASSPQSSTTASAARSHVNSRARASPAATSSSRRSSASSDPGRDRGHVERIDENGGVHRRPPPSRSPTDVTTGVPHAIASSDGQPEALVQRRIEDAARAAVKRRELRVGNLADPAVDLHASPATSADDAQLDACLAGSLDGATEILARLERRDREDVVALRARALGREDGVDAVRNDTNPLGRDSGELDRLVAA